MFGSGKKIKISDELYAKLEVAASIARCSSVEEFIMSVLETEADRVNQSGQQKDMTPEEIQAIENQLKGLGYLE